MIKAIFWDNDGILVDTEKFYFQSTREVLASFDIQLDLELYIKLFLKKNCGAWFMLEDLGITNNKIEQAKVRRDQRYLELIASESNLIDGAEDVLKKLHDQLPMGIVTSSMKEPFELIHKRTNCLQYIDFVIGNELCKKTKPNPEPYLKALKETNFKANECLVIEDSQRGLCAAKSAGMQCWIIPTELTADSDFSQADLILSSIKEIPAEIAKRR